MTTGFSSSHVWMWELEYKESWTLKNWYFWTVMLEKTLESPLDREDIQPVHPKGISPEYSLEGLMLELKLPYSVHLMRRTDSFEKTLMLGKIEGGGQGDNSGWDGWMASPTQWTWVWVSSRSWWWMGRPGMLQSMGSQRVGLDWATELILRIILAFPWGFPLGMQMLLRLIHSHFLICGLFFIFLVAKAQWEEKL